MTVYPYLHGHLSAAHVWECDAVLEDPDVLMDETNGDDLSTLVFNSVFKLMNE